MFGPILNRIYPNGWSMNRSEGAWLETAFDLLSQSRRRQVLYYLLETDRATIDDLARVVARAEAGASVDEIDGDSENEIAISLIHEHVPKLEAVGVIEYDRERDVVAVTDGFEEIRGTIERSRGVEREGLSVSEVELVTGE